MCLTRMLKALPRGIMLWSEMNFGEPLTRPRGHAYATQMLKRCSNSAPNSAPTHGTTQARPSPPPARLSVAQFTKKSAQTNSNAANNEANQPKRAAECVSLPAMTTPEAHGAVVGLN